MSISIERILNSPIDSNCFIIYSMENETCIIIDPGTEDCFSLIEFIRVKKLKPVYIFITHEHFDHIWGVNKLKETFDCKLVCSLICSEKIIAKKKNMSLFYNQVGFETYPADIYCEDIDNHMEWNGMEITFIPTKGHTDSSICILIDNNLFSGDTIIKNTKTVVKLPGGSKLKLIESLAYLNRKFKKSQIMIHAGHGESFWFDELKIQELI